MKAFVKKVTGLIFLWGIVLVLFFLFGLHGWRIFLNPGIVALGGNNY